jgi:predicted TIM-barrel fold metal-dependent hydrolase
MAGSARAILLICVAMTLGSCGREPADAPATATSSSATGEQTPTPKAPPPPWSRPGYERKGLIDFHGHLAIYGVERIGAILDELKIDLMINLSGGSGRRGERAWLLSQLLSERLGGRIVNFANVDWQGFGLAGWSAREAERLEYVVRRRGFRGLKISKALGLGVVDREDQLVAVDDPRLAPLWQKAGELGIPVSIHVADPKAFWAPLDDKNERFKELGAHPSWSYADKDVPGWAELLDASERVFKAHPKTTFVAVHFGNAAEEVERVDRMLDACPNAWIDLSARVGEFGRHPVERMKAFFLKHQDRILFATDIGVSDEYLMLGSNGPIPPQTKDIRPFYEAHFHYFEGNERQIDHPSPIQGDWKVDAIALPDAVLDKIYRGNALRLLASVERSLSSVKAPPSR